MNQHPEHDLYCLRSELNEPTLQADDLIACHELGAFEPNFYERQALAFESMGWDCEARKMRALIAP